MCLKGFFFEFLLCNSLSFLIINMTLHSRHSRLIFHIFKECYLRQYFTIIYFVEKLIVLETAIMGFQVHLAWRKCENLLKNTIFLNRIT